MIDGIAFFALMASTVVATGAFFVTLTICRKRKAAVEQLERLEAAMEASHTGTFDVDTRTGKIRWSRYHELLFGYKEGEFDGTRAAFRNRLHPEDYDRVVGLLERVRAEGGRYEFEARTLWPNGNILWLHARGQGLVTKTGEVYRIVGSVVDVTERKRLEDSLGKECTRADAANRAKSEFLANVSHEFRTPLTAINGFADVLLRTIDPRDAEKRSLVERIATNGHHLLAIINDILDLHKIEVGKFEFAKHSLHLKPFMAETCDLVAIRAKERNVGLKVHFADDLPEDIITDPLRLRQILLNLLGNALKFTRDGQITLTVSTTGSEATRQLMMDVEDTGAGIAPEERERLFRAFSQVDGGESRRAGGTGLGLYLSRRLAQGLGGDIQLKRSEPGRGSVFTLAIALIVPVTQGPRLASEESSPSEDRKALATALNGMRFLVVEDSPDIQMLIALMLKDAGAERVDLAVRGAEGVEMAMNDAPDVVLMDIQMPEMNGHEATRILRQRGFRRPILAVSAHAMRSDIEMSSASGCNGHVTKPIDRRRLIHEIRAVAAHTVH